MEAKASDKNLKAEDRRKELLKKRIAYESTQQSLQARVVELEQKCRALSEENAALEGSVKAVKLHLEGSSNLVKEKESNLIKATKELETVTELVKNLQNTVQEMEKRLSSEQKKLHQSLCNECMLEERVELLEEEQKELNVALNVKLEIIETLLHNSKEQTETILKCKAELSKKSQDFDKIQNEMIISKNEYKAELTNLQNKLKQRDSNEKYLQEKLNEFEKEKLNLVVKLATEVEKAAILQSNNEELQKNIRALEELLHKEATKIAEFDELILTSKENLKGKVQELEKILTNSQKDYLALEEVYAAKELSLNENITTFEEEKSALSSNLQNLYEIQKLEAEITDLTQKSSSIEQDMTQRSMQIEEIELFSILKKIHDSTNEYKEQLQILVNNLMVAESKVKALQTKHRTCSTKELSVKEQLQSIEEEKVKMIAKLDGEMEKENKLESQVEKLKKSIFSLRECLTLKYSNLDEIDDNLLTVSKNQYQGTVKEFEAKISTLEADCVDLQNNLKETYLKEASFIEKAEFLDRKETELNENLIGEIDKTYFVEKEIIMEFKKHSSALEEQLSLQIAVLEEFAKQKTVSKNEYETIIEALENKQGTLQVECAKLLDEVKEKCSNETALEKKLEIVGRKKRELNDNLIAEINKTCQLECKIQNLENTIASLNEQLSLQLSEIQELSHQMEISKSEYEQKIENLEDLLSTKHSANNELLECGNENSALLVETTNENSQFESNIYALKKICSFETEVSTKSLTLDEWDILKSEFQVAILELEKYIFVGNVDLSTLKEQLQVYIKASLKFEKEIEHLISEKETLSNRLDAEVNKVRTFEEQLKNVENMLNQNELDKELLHSLDRENEENTTLLAKTADENVYLKSSIHNLIERITSLGAESLCKTKIIEQISLLNSDYEVRILELERCLSLDQAELINIKKQLQVCCRKEIEHKELSDNSMNSAFKIQELEMRNEEYKTFIVSLEDDLVHILSTCETYEDEISTANMTDEHLKLEAENKLANLRSKYEFLRQRLNDYLLNESSLKEKLADLEKEKSHLVHTLQLKDFEISCHKSNTVALNEKIVSLQTTLSIEAEKTKKIEGKLLAEAVVNELKRFEAQAGSDCCDLYEKLKAIMKSIEHVVKTLRLYVEDVPSGQVMTCEAAVSSTMLNETQEVTHEKS